MIGFRFSEEHFLFKIRFVLMVFLFKNFGLIRSVLFFKQLLLCRGRKGRPPGSGNKSKIKHPSVPIAAETQQAVCATTFYSAAVMLGHVDAQHFHEAFIFQDARSVSLKEDFAMVEEILSVNTPKATMPPASPADVRSTPPISHRALDVKKLTCI